MRKTKQSHTGKEEGKFFQTLGSVLGKNLKLHFNEKLVIGHAYANAHLFVCLFFFHPSKTQGKNLSFLKN